MVYAFIIHTLNPPAGAGICRVLYSCLFGIEDMPVGTMNPADDQTKLSPSVKVPLSQQMSDLRTIRKEQLAQVARQVQSEFSFRKAVAVVGDYVEPGTSMHSITGLTDDSSRFEYGMFRLSAGDPFQTEKITVWLGLGNIGLALVCEKSENRPLAESTLKLLARFLQDYVQAITQPVELLTKGDRVAIIVHQFLPSGRLLFMNYAVIKQLEKDMDNLLRGK